MILLKTKKNEAKNPKIVVATNEQIDDHILNKDDKIDEDMSLKCYLPYSYRKQMNHYRRLMR